MRKKNRASKERTFQEQEICERKLERRFIKKANKYNNYMETQQHLHDYKIGVGMTFEGKFCFSVYKDGISESGYYRRLNNAKKAIKLQSAEENTEYNGLTIVSLHTGRHESVTETRELKNYWCVFSNILKSELKFHKITGNCAKRRDLSLVGKGF